MKIAVCCPGPSRPDSAGILSRMLEVQRARPWHQAGKVACDPGAVGWVATSDQFSRVPLARTGESPDWLLLTGVPICLHSSLNAHLEHTMALPFERRLEELTRIEGAFCALTWDEEGRRLGIVTDFLGIQPLYFARPEGGLLLASEIKALTATGLVPVVMDPVGWGAFLALGHSVGDATSVRDVRRVPAGAIWIWDPTRGALSEQLYWRWPEVPQEARADHLPLGELVEAFARNIRAYREHTGTGVLALSGGYDSRLALCLLAREGLLPQVLILRHREELFDADGAFARQIARRFGLTPTVCEQRRDYYSSAAYADYLVQSEVDWPSLYLFIAHLAVFLGPERQSVWEGSLVDFMLKHMRTAVPTFQDYVRQRDGSLSSSRWQAATRVFAPALAEELRQGFTEGYRRATGLYTDDRAGMAQFIARNRIRTRPAMNSAKVYANNVLPFLLGLTREVFELSASIPPSAGGDEYLHVQLYKRFFPVALSVPVVSWGRLSRCEARPSLNYMAARLAEYCQGSYRAGRLLSWLGCPNSETFWEKSKLVEQAVENADPGHPDLNADGVRALQRSPGPGQVAEEARHLLFYWDAWRRIMQGAHPLGGAEPNAAAPL